MRNTTVPTLSPSPCFHWRNEQGIRREGGNETVGREQTGHPGQVGRARRLLPALLMLWTIDLQRGKRVHRLEIDPPPRGGRRPLVV